VAAAQAGASTSPAAGVRKRGRKPLAKLAPTAPSAPESKARAETAGTTKGQIKSAIRELEIACAILRGQPINPVNNPDDVKKSRAGRT
jgi:hypothetical protein